MTKFVSIERVRAEEARCHDKIRLCVVVVAFLSSIL